MKKLILAFAFIVVGSISSFAQASCSCSTAAGGCSASQSCSAGEIAVCSCTSSGCVSYCQPKGGGDVPILTKINSDLKGAKAADYGKILSSLFNKTIVFSPASSNFNLQGFNSESSKLTHWDLFEFLAANGNLTINGQNVEFWNNLRNAFASGGEIKLCAGPANAREYLNEISFLTGKRFSVKSTGNASNKPINPVSGATLSELLQNISIAGQVAIKEL